MPRAGARDAAAVRYMAGARLRLLISCFLFAFRAAGYAAVPVRLPDCALMVFRHGAPPARTNAGVAQQSESRFGHASGHT